MRTLRELNERVWYRLIKVVYALLYLPYLFVLILGLFNLGRDYHPRILPKTIQEAFNDPEFFKANDYDKVDVLSSIDYEFNNLS